MSKKIAYEESRAYFLDEKRVKVDAWNGDEFELLFWNSINYQIDKQLDWSFTDDLVAPLFDKYYDGDSDVIMGVIYWKILSNNFDAPMGYRSFGQSERIRIGAKIKELRKEHNIGANALAELIGMDPASLSRIEQGKISVGIDVLSKIANALGAKVDLVREEKKV